MDSALRHNAAILETRSDEGVLIRGRVLSGEGTVKVDDYRLLGAARQDYHGRLVGWVLLPVRGIGRDEHVVPGFRGEANLSAAFDEDEDRAARNDVDSSF